MPPQHHPQPTTRTMWRSWIIGLLVYTCLNTVNSFIRTFPSRSTITISTTQRCAEEKKPMKPKKSKFDRVVDDFIGKRFGAGDYFYGERISQLTDEEYMNQYEAVDEEETIERPLKDNAILLVGSLEAMGQWVAFELAEKGFNIRVAVSSKAQAIKIFGQNNVDIVELSDQALGEDPYAKALGGVQAIVFLPAFKPFLDLGPLSATSRAEINVATRVLDAAKQQVEAAKASKQRRSSSSDIQKVVLVSRVVPWLLDNKSSSSSSGKVNVFSALLNERVDSDLYNGFRAVHADFEQQVRESGFDYVVVRAPPVVEEAKEGARSELVILDQSGSAVVSSSSSSSSSSSNAFSASVGMLDLAEAVSMGLIVDAPHRGVTFSVCETDNAARARRQEMDLLPLAQSDAMDEEYGKAGTVGDMTAGSYDRVQRSAYYGILAMGESEMKSAYMIKEAEVYAQQLSEDEALERFWTSRLANLPKDN